MIWSILEHDQLKSGFVVWLVKTLDNFNHLPKIILNEAERGDIVIFIGAGDISKWVNDLPSKLKKLKI